MRRRREEGSKLASKQGRSDDGWMMEFDYVIPNATHFYGAIIVTLMTNCRKTAPPTDKIQK